MQHSQASSLVCEVNCDSLGLLDQQAILECNSHGPPVSCVKAAPRNWTQLAKHTRVCLGSQSREIGDLGKPTHTLVPCWMPKPLPPRNQCTGWFALACNREDGFQFIRTPSKGTTNIYTHTHTVSRSYICRRGA